MVMSLMSNPKGSVATIIVAADGSGDTTDIQTGINMLPAGGGVVYIREGTYTITTTIIINVSNTSLIGAGRSTIINKTVAALPANVWTIYATGLSGIIINNLYVYGPGTGLSEGIVLNNCTYSEISKCWVANCGIGAIVIEAGSLYNLIYGNLLYNAASTGYAIGIILSNYNIISSNQCISNPYGGITISGDYNAVIGNQCISSGRGGIGIGGDYNAVIGNQCISNDRTGISISGDNNSITGNQCNFNDWRGIYLGTACNNNSITGNECIGNDTDDTATYDGITIDGDSNNNVITGNRCQDNDRYEIRIDDATGDKNLISSNICIGTDHVDTISDAGTNTQIFDNIES